MKNDYGVHSIYFQLSLTLLTHYHDKKKKQNLYS